jgi:hypothetical protein
VFLLYLSDSLFHIVPKAAFDNDAEQAEFRSHCSRAPSK